MDEKQTEKIEELFAPFDRSDAPGCVVAVAQAGRPVFRRAFGMASLDQGVANMPSTPMPVGSIAKQFTCAALLLLQAQGELSLEDRLERWLPELPECHRDVRLKQLMRHQGGVRCYIDQRMFNGYRTLPLGLPWNIQARQRRLNFTPGSRASYSNGGYLLLSEVIARAAGTDFADFIGRVLFRPAGMFASQIASTARPSRGCAVPHQKTPEGAWAPAAPLTEEAFGDGGMISTVDDLLRWARFLRTSQAPCDLTALSTPGEPSAPGPSDYRYGLIFQDWRGIRLAHHAGGIPGANSVLLMAPEQDLDIAILSNRPLAAPDFALDMLDILLDDGIETRPEPPKSGDFRDLLGAYLASGDGFLFALADVDGTLGISLFGEAAFALDSYAGDPEALPFWADAGAAQIRFRRGAAPGSLDYFDGVAWTPALRLDGKPSCPEELSAIAGARFHSPDAAATLTIEVDKEQLFLRVDGATGSERFEAECIAPDLIRFRSRFFPAGKLARLIRQDGAVRSIAVSTPRTQEMRFRRIEPSKGV